MSEDPAPYGESFGTAQPIKNPLPIRNLDQIIDAAGEERRREQRRQWRDQMVRMNPCWVGMGFVHHLWQTDGPISRFETRFVCQRCGARKIGSGLPQIDHEADEGLAPPRSASGLF